MGTNSHKLIGLAGVFVVFGTTAPKDESTIYSLPPAHALGATIARGRTPVGLDGQVIELADGRVLINDIEGRQLRLFDAALTRAVTIVGAVNGRGRYPRTGGTVLRYHGDSLLFANLDTRAFTVIDEAGVPVREIPFPAGPSPLMGPATRNGIRLDPTKDRIVYWAKSPGQCKAAATTDSVPLFRADLRSMVVDTVAYTHRFVEPCAAPPPSKGGAPRALARFKAMIPTLPPLNQRDEWAVLSDGTIEIVRAGNKILETIPADGGSPTIHTLAVSGRLFSRQAKLVLVDSLRRYYKQLTDSVFTLIVKNDPRIRSMPRADRDQLSASDLLPRVPRVQDIPDALSTVQGPIHVDALDRLWIPEAVDPFIPQLHRVRTSPTVFDVVSRDGQVVDRVKIPENSFVAGFGRGVVYLTAPDGAAAVLTRVKLR